MKSFCFEVSSAVLKGPVVFPVPLPLFLYFGKRIRHMLLSNEKDVPARSIGDDK